jgi:hypothetical protein
LSPLANTNTEAAGADYVGEAEYVQKIQQGWFDFDVVVATPDMMGEVGKLGRVLERILLHLHSQHLLLQLQQFCHL